MINEVNRRRLTCAKVECDNYANREEWILRQRLDNNLHFPRSVVALSVRTGLGLPETIIVRELSEENDVDPTGILTSADDHGCGIEHSLVHCSLPVDDIGVTVVELEARLLEGRNLQTGHFTSSLLKFCMETMEHTGHF